MVDARSSDIAHRGLTICNPVSSRTLDAVLERAPLEAGSLAVDVGCGKGELLLRLVARYPAKGLGIDLAQSRVDEACDAARRRGLESRVRFACMDARRFVPPQPPPSFAACVGSTHALGGLSAALRTLKSWTAPGGWMVVGEGFWQHAPDPEYLEALEAREDELGRQGWVEAAAQSEGLHPVQRWVSTREDWDGYEDALLHGIESYVRATPGDPSGPEMISRQRAFRTAQARWGRSTMGFAVHLLRKPR